MCAQAKSLGHGLSGTLYLINPVSLFKYDAVSRMERKGEFRLIRSETGCIVSLHV